ncbi:MAG: hypothetical protein WEB02_04110 [Methylophaga sp.]
MHYVFKSLLLCMMVMPQSGFANGFFTEGDAVVFQTSVWTHHYNDEPDHNNHQKLINLEYYFAPQHQPFPGTFSDWREDLSWLAGAATFKNSFDQQSVYVYGGSRYDWSMTENTDAYVKLTAGLLWGYRGEYRDKIPFNRLGVAPVILPAVGLQYRRANVELLPFAAAGIMMNVGWRFD